MSFSFEDLMKTLARHREKTPGKTVAKMDIEGAEYAALEEAHAHSLMCSSALTAMTIEWHEKMMKPCVGKEATTRLGCRFRNGDRRMRENGKWDSIMQSKQTCTMPAVRRLDDKMYLFDPVPFKSSSYQPKRTLHEYAAEQDELRKDFARGPPLA